MLFCRDITIMFRSTDVIFQICNSTSLDTPKEQKEEDGRCSFNTREMLKKAGKCATLLSS